MPICRKCNKKFPLRIKIDGKIKSTQNRKYCLECSPYGMHNTKKIHIEEPNVRKCPRCHTEKEESEFYNRRDEKGKSVYCKICTNLQTTERLQEFKKRCVEYKQGKCSCCGYDKYFGALEFHHSDPTKKDFTLSNASHFSFDDVVKKELDKCVMLCSNCHRELHAKLRGII